MLSSLHHSSLSSLAAVPLIGQTVRPQGTLTKQREEIASPDLFVFLFSLSPSRVLLRSPPGKREEEHLFN